MAINRERFGSPLLRRSPSGRLGKRGVNLVRKQRSLFQHPAQSEIGQWLPWVKLGRAPVAAQRLAKMPARRRGQSLPRYPALPAGDGFDKTRLRQSVRAVKAGVLQLLGLGVPGKRKAVQPSEQVISLRIFRVGFDVS